MKNFRKNQGITLIALVITVIVLLILASVTIATLTGENGILNRAQEANNKTDQAEKDEKEKLGDMEDVINEYNTGIEVEQVTDENPGVLEIDENNVNTYIINSIEDLVFFSNDVTEGNTYEGKTVKLGLSLDFKSNKSYVDPFRTDYGKYGYSVELKTLLTSGEGFIPIGKIVKDSNQSKENLFSGIFDGDYNAIYNIKINENINITNQYFGIAMFAYNYGEIKNLGIKDANISISTNADKFGNIAIMIGRNYGNINNCYTTGKLIAENLNYSINVGGIAGANVGTINQSYNLAEINTLYEELNNIKYNTFRGE